MKPTVLVRFALSIFVVCIKKRSHDLKCNIVMGRYTLEYMDH